MSNRGGIVTGAASGIGRAVVNRLLQDGATVYAFDRDEAGLDRLKEALMGQAVHCIVGDVTDPDEAEELAKRCVNEQGGLDFLVNAAGIIHPSTALHELELAAFERVQAVNLKGVLVFYRAAVRQMMAAGTKGGVVNIASVAGIRPVPGSGAYVASKHAVVGFTTSAALEVAGRGIRVNAVCPGMTDTPMFRANMAGGTAETMMDAVPIGRIGTPDEMANVVYWLLSDQASYVTGAIIPVDGGLSLL